MAQARRRDAWDRTSDLMALWGNLHAGQAVWSRADFHPFADHKTELPGLEGFAGILPRTEMKVPHP